MSGTPADEHAMPCSLEPRGVNAAMGRTAATDAMSAVTIVRSPVARDGSAQMVPDQA